MHEKGEKIMKTSKTGCKTLFFLTLFVVLTFSEAIALTINSVSGTISNGSSITISGSGFGTKTTPAPWVWDNFEDGTNANLVGTSPKGIWQEYYSVGTTYPKYSTTAAYAGSLGAKKTTAQAEEFVSYGASGLNSDEMYYSIMFKWTEDVINDSGAEPVMKLTRLNTQGDFYSPQPSIYTTLRTGTGNGWTYGDARNGTGDLYNEPFLLYVTLNTWHRIEVYWKLSTAGVANGKVEFYIDNVEKEDGLWDNVITRATGYANQKSDNFLLPMMQSLGSTNIYSFYADDVYVDRTRARVEVCNTATWSARTRCEIQIPSAWSDTAITFTGNQGTSSNFSNSYLYVIDKNGNVNSNGYRLCPSCPQPPANLTAQ